MRFSKFRYGFSLDTMLYLHMNISYQACENRACGHTFQIFMTRNFCDDMLWLRNFEHFFKIYMATFYKLQNKLVRSIIEIWSVMR